MAAKKTAKEIEDKFLMVEGIVKAAKIGSTKFDKDDKARLSIKTENLDIYDEIDAFDNSGEKFTPDWYKQAEGYLNFSSKFDIPVLDENGRRLTFEEWIETGTALGSNVRVKFKNTDGAVYPVAAKVLEPGEPFDVFEGM